jgi:hypothetical protein
MAINPIGQNQYDPYNYSFGSLSGKRGQQVQGNPQVDVNGQTQNTQRTNRVAFDNQYVTNAALYNAVSALDKPAPDTRTETQGNRLYAVW